MTLEIHELHTFHLSRWLRAADALARRDGRPWSEVAGLHAGVVCLHSARLDGALGRSTLIAANPVAEAVGAPDDVTLYALDGAARVPFGRFTDPFAALDALLDAFPQDDPGLEGFCGGAIGALGYGCRSALERLPDEVEPPLGPELWFGLYDTWAAFDGLSGRGFIASRGVARPGADPDPALAAARVAAWREALDDADDADEAPPPPWPALAPALTREAWGVAFRRVMEGIAAGDLYQACLTFPLIGPRRAEHQALPLFLRLCREHPAPFAALLAPGDPNALAGASIERFLRVQGGVATARPMKGTRPRGASAQEDAALREALHNSPKDRAENVMIVDLMRNDLGRVCQLGAVHVPALFTVETYPTVHQLTSTIEGTLLRPRAVTDAIRACFPPGSMTGAPKVAAMSLLGHLEAWRRGWYAGALGWIDARRDAELAVTIRSLLLSTDTLRWHVGGGIVADSVEDEEWEEALIKSSVFRGAARRPP